MKPTEKAIFGVIFLFLFSCYSYASTDPRKLIAQKELLKIERVRELILNKKSNLKNKIGHRKIGSRLNSLIAQKMKITSPRGLLQKDKIAANREKVKIVLNTSRDISGDLDKIKAHGARIIKKRHNMAALEIPVNSLEKMINEIDIIKHARLPLRFFPQGVLSEGVTLTETDNFHNIGFAGAGVKIAVIDLGFKGLTEAHLNGDLPYNTLTHDFTGNGIETEHYHGTACAEIVHDMAPQAELHLLKVLDEIDIYGALDYCVDNDIDIISISLGIYGTGPGDGTGSLDEAFDEMRANGILVVAAAGNQGNFSIGGATFGTHWKGPFADYNDDNFHEFIPGDFENIFTLIAAIPSQDDDGNSDSGEVNILMRWNDWPYAYVDYDMILYEYDIETGEIEEVATSLALQNGSQPPIESIALDIPDDEDYEHYYALVILKTDGEPPGVDMEIHLGGTSFFLHDENLQSIATSTSSIVEPADAESVLAVGAIDHLNWETGPQENFSSQGPTKAWAGSSARIKPDIMGPDGVTTYSYDTSFFGTSAATPHVAGLAASILSMDPDMTPDELQASIESNAIDMGASGKDNIYGWGRVRAVTLTLRDGGEGDDGSVNGVIVDPSGPGLSPVTSSPSGGGGGGCFIATAAFGSLMEPHVVILRQFRDRYLLTNAVGKSFVDFYYRVSPPVAALIAKHDSLRMITRLGLIPFIWISGMAVHLGLIEALLLLSVLITIICVLSFARIKKVAKFVE